MSERSFKKGLTLVSSISLVTLFLLYRTGSFDDHAEAATVQVDPDKGELFSFDADTIKPKDTAVPLRLSSSKVIILADYDKARRDSVKKKRKVSKAMQSSSPVFFSGSKSGRVFKTEQFYKPVIDTFGMGYDSVKSTKKKQ